ncbi:hypothetical protein GQ457_08G034940 [Hibiscus cannabinus]
MGDYATISASEGCVPMLNNLPQKLKDPDNFTIPCSIGKNYVGRVLCDLGASVNLIPKLVFMKLGMRITEATT